MNETVDRVARAAAYGIRVITRRFAATVAILAIAAGTGIVVAYPLWYLAENHTGTYTVIALTAIVAGVLVTVIRRITSARRAAGEAGKRSGVLARVVWAISGAIVVYATVVTAISGRFVIAAVLGSTLILITSARVGFRHGERTGDRP